MTLSRIGLNGVLCKDTSSEGFALCSPKAHKTVLDLLITLRTEANPSVISEKILKAYIHKHGDTLLEDDAAEGRALGLESGDESGMDN